MDSLFDYNEFNPGDPAYLNLVEVYEYWQSKKQDRFAPSWTDINLIDLPIKFISRISVVDVHTDALDFTYRFWGTGITRAHQYDLTGKSVLELQPESYGKTAHHQYKMTFEGKKPRGFSTEIPAEVRILPENSADTEIITHYHDVRMPLSSNGQDVDVIMNVANFVGER